jgi:hypothetical protein
MRINSGLARVAETAGWRAVVALAFLFHMAAISCSDAQTPTLLDPHQTDPVSLGIMQGFPPSPDKAVRFDNGTSYRFPLTRWAFSHMRELVPTSNV